MSLFKRITITLFGAPLILFSIGLIFFAVGGGLTYNQILFRQGAIQVQGEVIDLSENCDDDGCTYSPIVQFTTTQDEIVYYHSTYGSYPSEFEIGEVVNIQYKSDNPEKAMISGEGGLFRFIFMGVGGIIFLVGLILFALNLKNSILSE